MQCDFDIRQYLYKCVLLAGGPSMFSGFRKRVLKEIRSLGNNVMKMCVFGPYKTNDAAWLGGSIIGSLSSFPLMSITDGAYEEDGPLIVHRKCF
ncbi:actin-10-related [Anaeramoeba flamelloides]|uniref:Actin-10-related n=1 Tax=Anaeramoeba flamelloides TaxID=1746091 RepID=A0AAV7YDY1_9EUKA|nr:actin-10-related [Anaeramoeba flamelloides]